MHYFPRIDVKSEYIFVLNGEFHVLSFEDVYLTPKSTENVMISGNFFLTIGLQSDNFETAIYSYNRKYTYYCTVCVLPVLSLVHMINQVHHFYTKTVQKTCPQLF